MMYIRLRNGIISYDKVIIGIGEMKMEFYKALVGEKSNKKNIFSDLIGEWDMEWVDGKGTENGLNLWVFDTISKSNFHWESKTSFDNGKTWITNGEVFAKKRGGN